VLETLDDNEVDNKVVLELDTSGVEDIVVGVEVE